MSNEQKPGDPADKGADTFVATVNHRSGYGDDRLERLVDYLRRQPSATLASGEGALLLAEMDRLRDDLQKQADWADWAKGEMDRMHAAAKNSMDHYTDARDEIDRLRVAFKIERANTLRLERILAALREPSEAIVDAVTDLGDSFEYLSRLDVYIAVRAAVTAAEQEIKDAR